MRTRMRAFPGLAVVLAVGVSVMAQGAPRADRRAASDSSPASPATPAEAPSPRSDRRAESNFVSIQGRVVDDETGDTIEYFSLQKGLQDGRDPSKIAWQHPRRIPGSGTIVDGRTVLDRNPHGEFSDSVGLGEGEGGRRDRIRILADGYEPEPVLDRLPGPADAGKTVEVTVRLRRGRSLAGRVVDHAGRPAAGAKLFLIRPGGGGSIRVVDDVMGEGSDTGLLDPSVTRAAADEQGRFRITGVGDATLVGVSAPTLHFWTAPVPPPGEELAIRLPEPATLRIPYAIEGDAAEAHIWLHLKQPEDLAQRLWVTRTIKIPNRGEAILRDAAPGEYTLWRRKMLPIGEHPRRTSVELRKFTLESGKAAEVSFVREGRPVSGTVLPTPGGVVLMLYVGIASLEEPDLRSPSRRWLDIVACDEEGRFRTAHVPPGEYVVHAAGYRFGPRHEPFGTFNDRIDFNGSVPVTVPPDGNPPEVRIMLEGR
jgi:hypothetical protein